MSTGDVPGNVARVLTCLRSIRYPLSASPFDVTSAVAGHADAFLPCIAYVLSYHPILATYLNSRYALSGLTDAVFVSRVWSLLNKEWSYKPVLSQSQFLGPGFGERKLLFLADIVGLCVAWVAKLPKDKQPLPPISPSLKRAQIIHEPESLSNSNPRSNSHYSTLSSDSHTSYNAKSYSPSVYADRANSFSNDEVDEEGECFVSDFVSQHGTSTIKSTYPTEEHMHNTSIVDESVLDAFEPTALTPPTKVGLPNMTLESISRMFNESSMIAIQEQFSFHSLDPAAIQSLAETPADISSAVFHSLVDCPEANQLLDLKTTEESNIVNSHYSSSSSVQTAHERVILASNGGASDEISLIHLLTALNSHLTRIYNRLDTVLQSNARLEERMTDLSTRLTSLEASVPKVGYKSVNLKRDELGMKILEEAETSPTEAVNKSSNKGISPESTVEYIERIQTRMTQTLQVEWI